MSVKLSALVITRNESRNIERCVRSLGFADEIVVVDAHSDDDTARIAEREGARVVTNAWPGFARQREFALEHATGDWVLACDADEEVTPELAEEIRDVIARDDNTGYRVQRTNQYLGRWIKHGPWTRDFVLRLFRTGAASVTPQSVHEGYTVEGPVGTLRHRLNHYTHPTLSESVDRLNRYTSLEAHDRVDRRRVGVFDPLIPPVGVFFKYYFLKGCWREGVHGFLLAVVTAMYKSVLYIKIYFLQRGHLDTTQRRP